MTIVINKSSGKEEINKILQSLPRTGKLDSHKFCGKIKLKKAPLEIQKEMRDEWE